MCMVSNAHQKLSNSAPGRTISSYSTYSGRQASVASCRTITIKRYLYNEGH